MTLWNVVVPIVALIEAETGQEAQRVLADRLRATGFDTYDGARVSELDPFVSEDGTEPSVLPGGSS